MRFKEQLLLLLLLTSCGSNHKPAEIPLTFEEMEMPSKQGPILFLIQSGKIKEAVDALLQAQQNDANQSDPYIIEGDLLKRLGLHLLETGMNSHDEKDILLSLYGIQLSGNEEALTLAQKLITCQYPELQLAAIQVLANYNTDEANQLLEQALKSDYLLIRLEAAFAIATKKLPTAYAQIESLMVKVEPDFRPAFPKLFAICANPASQQMLKRLLRDPDERVRLETVHAICEANLSDLLPDLKTLYSDNSPAIQESIAEAIGIFQDSSSKNVLEKLQKSHYSSTQLAAFFAAYESTNKFGDNSSRQYIEELALDGNCFAINLLGKMGASSKDILYKLMHCPDSSIAVNAAIALLELKDPRSIEGLQELFIQNPKDLIFEEMVSHGRTLSYYKLTPSASENIQRDNFLFELSLRLREQMLINSLELPEESFLQLAQIIFEKQQLDLVPTLIRLLENLRSEKAIALLKEQSERPGCPLIRAYANLALFRLHEEGPYFAKVNDWVKNNSKLAMIEMRPQLPWALRNEKNPYILSLEEQARLLLECSEALAQSRDREGLKTLLIAIRDGNPHNRYLLAGLLLQASQ
jgi:HEAT repeat protein